MSSSITQQNVLNPVSLMEESFLKLAKKYLSTNGFTLITHVPSQASAKCILEEFGDLIPQYNGLLEYDVKAESGFENFQYTKSTNYISPHTEAPDYSIPPKFLALYCINQAKCGGGKTSICDTKKLQIYLTDEERNYLLTQEHEFIGGNIGPKDEIKNSFTSVCLDIKNSILRFSYNYFTDNNVHGRLENTIEYSSDLFDLKRKSIAQSILNFFNNESLAILIPEKSILIWNNHQLLHGRSTYSDKSRHLIRYWLKKKEDSNV